MDVLIEFSKRLRTLRGQRGYTAEQLAEKSDLSVGHIRQLEKGSRAPTLSSLITLSNALDVTPISMMLSDFTEQSETNIVQNEDISFLNDKQICFILDTIDGMILRVKGIYDECK
ncbi:helix-turn-helix domain-containing protein [Agathobaculum sp. NTUH-O15-33]|uniref:helix-turn-helix domain-containing protein n=1 Tax=Agathobaculum sp. NTUH-O15-33 TaxID=3079302 RepID=UPI002958B61D|nr:helix-turn-helix domain-containing protein [Agathobaculum sp. NTUH-O15-33]WNX84453.1 helix-turn-helix domain-containing protein [Agathobaculum sp. NTUH-O15-33]